MVTRQLAFAITTAPRPVPTLARSLASFRAAGWTHRVEVSAESDPGPLEDAAVRVSVNPTPLGVLRHWVHALRLLVERSEASHLVVLQDDAKWAEGAACIIQRRLEALGPFWTWYVDPRVGRQLERQYRQARLRPGVYDSRLGYQSNGAVCYGFARALADRLLQSSQLADYLATHRNANIDRVIPACALALGVPLQVWVPGYVSHAFGAGNSSIKPKRPRDTRYWQAVAS